MSPKAKRFAVIGSPVSHSLSPLMHEAGLKSLKIEGSYDAVEVAPSHLENFMTAVKTHRNYTGLNITIPHKEQVVEFCDELTEAAKQMGCVNTFYRRGDNWIGDNTDGKGYLTSLKNQAQFDPKNKSIVILGAGGASRAVAFALMGESPKEIILVNRSMNRAEKLKSDLEAISSKTPIRLEQFKDFDNSKSLEHVDLLINTTSLGLESNPWPSLKFVDQLSDSCLVSDIVYSPVKTELIQAALDRNLVTLPGWGMLLYQGVHAFERFTKKDAPVEAMEKALKDGLKIG